MVPLAFLLIACVLAEQNSLISPYSAHVVDGKYNNPTWTTTPQPYNTALPQNGLVHNSLGFLPLTKVPHTVFAYSGKYYSVELDGVVEIEPTTPKKRSDERRPIKTGETGYCPLCTDTAVTIYTTNYQDLKDFDWYGETSAAIPKWSDLVWTNNLGMTGRNTLSEGFTSQVHNNKTLRFALDSVHIWPTSGWLVVPTGSDYWTVSWGGFAAYQAVPSLPSRQLGLKLSVHKLTGVTLAQSSKVTLKTYKSVGYITLDEAEGLILGVMPNKKNHGLSANTQAVFLNGNEVILPLVYNTGNDYQANSYTTEYAVVFGQSNIILV